MKTLGLDIGTTTISAAVYDQTLGVIASRTVKNESFLPGQAWERIQDPGIIYAAALESVTRIREQHPDICAMGLTGQMHGILYLDAQGDPVSPLYTWQDGRGNLPWDETRSWAAHLSSLTGYPLATGYGLVTHFYNLRNGLVPDKAVTLCTIHDYLAMKFSGRTAPLLEATDAASLGLFDGPGGCFDAAALEKAGIDAAFLPQMVKAPYLGTGMLGIPVFAGIGDNQASFLGATGGRTDVLLVNMGTGGQISVYSPRYLHTPHLETRPFPDGGWLLVGASLCGGRSYALLEAFFRQTVAMVTGSDDSVYDAMTRLLETSPRPENIPRIVTHFQGTRSDPSQRAVISGLGADSFTPLHFLYGIMQGMADELYGMYKSYLDLGGISPGVMIGSGNGLRRNPHLCRILEDTFRCRLVLSENDEEAACGAAIYAARHFR